MATKNPDPRILLALYDRIEPKPAFSSQTLPVPIDLDISSPQAVEKTRQNILTMMGNQSLPIEIAERVMKIVNEGADRSIMQDIEDILKEVEALKEERIRANTGPVKAPEMDADGAIGVSAVSGEVVKLPNWGNTARKAETDEEIKGHPDGDGVTPDTTGGSEE